MATTTSASTAPRRDSAHASAQPVPVADRVFGFGQHASLWFSLGVDAIYVSSFSSDSRAIAEAIIAQAR